ncbi:MAG: YkgJ family cysteine cluster protein [Thermodesulfobacteriota bacterium]|nr:YkgJ family cysteine cluster protein [Thermodesulfobacteriota bacterium]
MNEEYVEKRRMLSKESRFKFACHNGLSCFKTCCADINIFLTPYDLLRMRRTIGLSSGEFLEKYTIPLLTKEGLPLLVLKMTEDENKSCPFIAAHGCEIFEDRPWSCRMHPIFPSSKGGFFIEEGKSCLGFKEEKTWTIEEWKKDQGIDSYDKMNESYETITLNDYFLKGNTLDPEKSKMLYMVCYDLDEFKKYLLETRFFDIYNMEKENIEKLTEDDEELLSFGYRWARFNLFGEDTLRLNDKTFDKIMQTERKESESL